MIRKVKPIEIDYPLPWIISRDIDEMLEYMNSTAEERQYSLDLYQSNLIADLNAYDNLPREIVLQLKDYYCRGGIYE